MGRKIPVRKHRGVKDPLVQLARRNACPTINATPSNPDHQELPKSVVEIQRLCALAESREKFKNGKKKQGNSRNNLIDSLYLYDKDPKLPGMRRKDRGVPRVVQRTDEPDEAFLYRFSSAAQEFINEVELENKHDVSFEGLKKKNEKGKSDSQDEVSDEKPSKSQAGSNESRKRKHPDDSFTGDFNMTNKKGRVIRKSRFGNVSTERGTKPNKRQRKKLRLAQIKKEEHHEDEMDSEEEQIDFQMLKDEVMFGEVVHRPPQFTAKPRGSELSSKPGTKDLLLKQMMNNSKEKDSKKTSSNILSNAQKHFLEKERIRVVQAYRDLKASKMKR